MDCKKNLTVHRFFGAYRSNFILSGKTYEFQVRYACGEGFTDWNDSQTFMTTGVDEDQDDDDGDNEDDGELYSLVEIQLR